MIDFTDCKQYKKSYSGANGNKKCIEYNGERYMLKFPSSPTRNTELSYTNSCMSEYIGCHIYDFLNIPVQQTLLGTYRTEKSERIVIACKDFVEPGTILQDFGSLKNQIVDSKYNGYGTELSDILDAIDEQQVMEPGLIKERFWDMFVCDALLGNFDRHNGNWGFLYNQFTDEVSLAPVYDCGSCLYPHADEETIQKILSNKRELETRIYNFPTSAVKNNGKKIPYYQYLINTKNADCLKSVSNIYPLINLKKISSFINNIECLTDLQKQFYTTVLNARYELILKPAYERVTKLQKDLASYYDGLRLSESLVERQTENIKEIDKKQFIQRIKEKDIEKDSFEI